MQPQSRTQGPAIGQSASGQSGQYRAEPSQRLSIEIPQKEQELTIECRPVVCRVVCAVFCPAEAAGRSRAAFLGGWGLKPRQLTERQRKQGIPTEGRTGRPPTPGDMAKPGSIETGAAEEGRPNQTRQSRQHVFQAHD